METENETGTKLHRTTIDYSDRSSSPTAASNMRIENQLLRRRRAETLLSSVAYSISSCGMILVNKVILSAYKWQAPATLMLFQNLVATVFLFILRILKLSALDPFSLKIIKLWMPVNFIFVGMLLTSFYSLKFLQVPMVTILKNCTNILTAIGESYYSNKSHGLLVWFSLFLTILSAICAGLTDLSFHPVGYSWQALNCFLTASYSLLLRHIMLSVREFTHDGKSLDESSMVLLNSFLSLPLGLIVIFLIPNEVSYVSTSITSMSWHFFLSATVSALMGIALNFSSLWCIRTTGPTTHGLIGSLNKIPLTVLGILLFDSPMNFSNLASITVGLFGGVILTVAKTKKNFDLAKMKHWLRLGGLGIGSLWHRTKESGSGNYGGYSSMDVGNGVFKLKDEEMKNGVLNEGKIIKGRGYLGSSGDIREKDLLLVDENKA